MRFIAEIVPINYSSAWEPTTFRPQWMTALLSFSYSRDMMSHAMYVRVSTPRQAQTQTIERQLQRLQEAFATRVWPTTSDLIFRDDGYSGASLSRPGLDRLREHGARAEITSVRITAPDRLARKYVHQVLLIEEFERAGCQIDVLDRP